jgi:hypothetical protein
MAATARVTTQQQQQQQQMLRKKAADLEVELETYRAENSKLRGLKKVRTHSVILLFFLSFLVWDVSLSLSYPSMAPCLLAFSDAT